MIIELSVRRELSVEEADGAWRRRWYFSECVCLSFTRCLSVGSVLISTDSLSVVASSVREHLSQLVQHQPDTSSLVNSTDCLSVAASILISTDLLSVVASCYILSTRYSLNKNKRTTDHDLHLMRTGLPMNANQTTATMLIGERHCTITLL